jgi:predicted DNA-binding WGR domain protein
MLKIYKYAEFHDDNTNSHKYYAVTVEESPSVSIWKVTWGRVETRGQEQILSQHECLNRFDSKIAKGYTNAIPKNSWLDNIGAKNITGNSYEDRPRAKREKVPVESFSEIERLIAAIK